ncbi:MAG TPA: acyl carrier protein [Thermoanaerobaculia bacterium]|jgi:acyl carrier protein|nr:acyl carrier protein [Thermoanaerobaculia bacterium]
MTKLLEILTEIRPESSFSESHDFLDDGLLDSFDIVMLVSSLDKTFGISIEGIEIVPENFRNLEAIRALLRKHGVET